MDSLLHDLRATLRSLRRAPTFTAAESFHQQYCIRNPEGYCGHGGTGVAFPKH